MLLPLRLRAGAKRRKIRRRRCARTLLAEMYLSQKNVPALRRGLLPVRLKILAIVEEGEP
jgi:hypothetical protein